MKRVDIIYFDVTSAHRSSAQAIAKALNKLDTSFQLRVLNLTDILEHHPILQNLAHLGVNIFNWGVRHERAYFARHQVGFFQTIQSMIPRSAIRRIAKFWSTYRPDVVVSVMPICNLMLERTLHVVYPNCPYVIMPVDFQEPKRDYWFDTRINAYYINPTSMLTQQAVARGVQPQRQITVTGMPIDPLFYESPTFDRTEALTQLGLNPNHPTVLVGFGGQGSVLVRQCAEQLSKANQPINAIYLCGRHKALYEELSELLTPYPKVVLNYSPQPPAYYYHLADIIIGKPGSMTITEAIVTRTALLAVESNSLALVQRSNEAWLRQSGVGEVIGIHDLPDAVHRILSSKVISTYIEREWHRGVFEIAEVISNIAHGIGLQIGTEITGEIAKS